MKTQLLQDFQESGSTQAPPPQPPDPPPAADPGPAAPARPARPAVWHGPGAQRAGAGAAAQRADAGAMQRAPDTQARGLGVAIEAWAERAAQHRPAPSAPPPAAPPPVDEAAVPGPQPRAGHVPPPRPPEPAAQAFAGHVPPPRPPESAAPAPRTDAGFDPGTIPRPTQADAQADWLAARLREDAARREEPAWSSMWKRRLVTWSIAGSLLAALAAGGLWLYEDNRVDGALVVVANTSPASPEPAAHGAQAFAAGAPAPAPALPAPSATAEPVKPLPPPPAPDAASAPAPALDTSAAPAALAADQTAAPVDLSPPRRAPRHASSTRRHAAQARRARVADEPPAAGVPSPRQRREETLMQCRAHGYDERQCIQRGCTMTRYGLACRG